MASSSVTAGRRAVEASTMAEAFRLTVANHPDRVAVLFFIGLSNDIDRLAGEGFGIGR